MTWEISQRSLLTLAVLFMTAGFALGGVYDIFRIRRLASAGGSVGKKGFFRFVGGLLVGIEDLIFFIFAGIIASVLYFAVFRGRVRLFAIGLGVLGFVLWRLTLGRLVMACANVIITLIRAVFSFIANRILKPPARAIKRFFARITGRIQKSAKRRRVKKTGRARKGAAKSGKKGFKKKTPEMKGKV